MKTFMAILLVPMVSSHLWMASLTLLTNMVAAETIDPLPPLPLSLP